MIDPYIVVETTKYKDGTVLPVKMCSTPKQSFANTICDALTMAERIKSGGYHSRDPYSRTYSVVKESEPNDVLYPVQNKSNKNTNE